MTQITEGALIFTFPDGWQVAKADDWSFYRNQFAKHFDGVRLACKKCNAEVRCCKCGTAKTIGAKAVDILAIEPGSVAWLIEVKDYRRHRRTKAVDLADEIAVKVRDSLAMFVAASKNANVQSERVAASAVGGSSSIRVVLHVEQAPKPSKLFPRAINPANVKQRLRRLIKFVDLHPLIVETSYMDRVAWSVTSSSPQSPP